ARHWRCGGLLRVADHHCADLAHAVRGRRDRAGLRRGLVHDARAWRARLPARNAVRNAQGGVADARRNHPHDPGDDSGGRPAQYRAGRDRHHPEVGHPRLVVEALNMTETTGKRSYVVHAYSGFEHQVARALAERVKRSGMEDKFGEVLVPTEEVVEMRGGQKRKSERKFFPGYVLVQIETTGEARAPRIDDECWHLVKETPKVMGFIGGT